MRSEKGSVTLFVLIAMIFFLTIALSAYVSVSSKWQGQNSDLTQIKENYEQHLSVEGLASLYDKLTMQKETYVSDGLVLHLDAINNTGEGHSNITNTWKDLSEKGNDAIISNYDVLNWSEDCYVTNRVESITTPLRFESSHTISVLFTPLQFFNYNTIWDNSLTADDNECWIYNNGNLNVRSSRGKYISSGAMIKPTLNEKIQITLTVDAENNVCSIYSNGNIVNTITGGINLNGGQLVFNGSTNTKGKNKYYSIKVYDRALVTEEVIQNYNVDKQRFEIE